MVVAPPALLTTTIDFFSCFSMASANARAPRSVTPPGGYGTTSVMVRSGYSANAERVPTKGASTKASEIKAILMNVKDVLFIIVNPPLPSLHLIMHNVRGMRNKKADTAKMLTVSCLRRGHNDTQLSFVRFYDDLQAVPALTCSLESF